VAGDALFKQLAAYRLEQAVDLGPPQARGIDQQYHVGRAGRAFALQAGQYAGVVGIDAVDADAGGLGEVLVQRFVGLVMAR
jgi:hypothetical protein